MFGSKSPKMPAAPTYSQPGQYTAPGQFQSLDPSQSNLNSFVPQVPSAGQISSEALGVSNTGSSEQNMLEYGPWLSLRHSPLDSANMQQAENYYQQTQVNPQLAQMQANAQANGQGGSSALGAALGETQGMGSLNSFQAGLAENQQNFQNILAARNSLYGGPIGMTQQQDMAPIDRALSIAGMNQNQQNQQNAYGMGSAQMQNNYNMGSSQMRNQFDLGNYGNQMQGYQIGMQNATNRDANAMNFGGGLFKTAVGDGGIGNPFGGGNSGGSGGFSGLGYGASNDSSYLGSVLGGSPAPMQTIHGSIK